MARPNLSPLNAGIRLDSRRSSSPAGRWTNVKTGQGGPASRAPFTEYDRPSPLDRVTIDSLLQFNGIGRRLATREPDDATRAGLALGEGPAADAVLESMRMLGALGWLKRGRTWARAYGGAAIIPLVDDGRKAWEPIDYGGIKRICGARVLNRWEITPASYDTSGSGFRVGEVEMWNIQARRGTPGSMRVHHSRVIPLQGFDLPDDVMDRQNGWGGSVFDLAWAELRNYGASLDLLPEFVTLLTQAVYKQKGLAAGVAADKAEEIAARYETLQAGLSILNALALDAEGESYEVMTRPVTGLREVFEVMVQALVAAGDMPRVILLGETPGGLHAGADSPEVRAWYDHVAAQQDPIYTPPLMELLRLLMLSWEGPTGGQLLRLKPYWNPLYQPTQEEIDKHDLARAQRRSVDAQGGYVSEMEIRQDPDLVEHYQIDPDEDPGVKSAAQADPGLELDDAEELLPVQAADPSLIPPGETLISGRDAGRIFGCSPGTIRRMALANRFPAFRIGRQWRYARSLIERAAHTGGV